MSGALPPFPHNSRRRVWSQWRFLRVEVESNTCFSARALWWSVFGSRSNWISCTVDRYWGGIAQQNLQVDEPVSPIWNALKQKIHRAVGMRGQAAEARPGASVFAACSFLPCWGLECDVSSCERVSLGSNSAPWILVYSAVWWNSFANMVETGKCYALLSRLERGGLHCAFRFFGISDFAFWASQERRGSDNSQKSKIPHHFFKQMSSVAISKSSLPKAVNCKSKVAPVL